MRVVLFGGTELTVALAEAIRPHVVGVVAVPSAYTISTASEKVTNARFADISGWARLHGIPAIDWTGVETTLSFVTELRPDLGLAAGWYYLLPDSLLSAFEHGVAGVHASLLPKY